MTQKDYIKIAKVLKESREQNDGVDTLARLYTRFVDMLVKDNPRFSEHKFFKAVYKAF